MVECMKDPSKWTYFCPDFDKKGPPDFDKNCTPLSGPISVPQTTLPLLN